MANMSFDKAVRILVHVAGNTIDGNSINGSSGDISECKDIVNQAMDKVCGRLKLNKRKVISSKFFR
jgi:hypothetical protein